MGTHEQETLEVFSLTIHQNWTAEIYVREELELPIPLTLEDRVRLRGKTSIDLAHEVLYFISNGLLTKNNCIPIIRDNEIETIVVRRFQNLNIGDIVTLNPISANDYDFCFCRIFIPDSVGYCRVLELEDSDGDVKIECLSSGRIMTSGRQFWIKVEQTLEIQGSDDSSG